MNVAKPFDIPKKLVAAAFRALKNSAGGAGIDKETIGQFELKLKDNLYKIWNRMSSGTYFPPPVKAVAIPKKSGGERILGVPTVSASCSGLLLVKAADAVRLLIAACIRYSDATALTYVCVCLSRA